ncbi:MAG: T9SS type A sorting domain-containing protein [Ignavibacteriae bacterium]|nr:T9SS C-terminal target domain-containing protein [Ignavibacteriota bacterium]NOG97651.1 T9SS type A sorting domain-containing protein [Ignavibacteriota bacterium]
MYSGDPVTGTGWLQTFPTDQRLILSTGPFRLKAGEPIELMYAYIVGRGTDHLNSITAARNIAQDVQVLYNNNFEDMPTGVGDDENLIADEFRLYQNYPNPFNPTTTIKFTTSPFNPSPYQGEGNRERLITLKVYDILGREIKTLINEQKPAGTYEVQFDASQLSSGVYFYYLSAGDFVQTKKLILIK